MEKNQFSIGKGLWYFYFLQMNVFFGLVSILVLLEFDLKYLFS